MSCADRVTIYHNARCSKSRGALELLRARGIEPEVVNYQETPPSAAEFERLLGLLGLEPRALMRSGEPEYAELGLADPGLPRAALIEALVRHPKLIERPIVVRGERAVIGRPQQRVLELLA